jgi:uncharacterized protein (TIGR03435 family)
MTLALTGAVYAQSIQTQSSQSLTPLDFEVASIKPSPDFRAGFGGQFRGPSIGGILTVGNASLKNMIVFAYGIRDSQVVGGPSWIRGDQFDTNAKMEGPAITDPNDRLVKAKLMFQALIVRHFALKFHWETKQGRGYELVVGSNGPNLGVPNSDLAGSEWSSGRQMLLCNGSMPGPEGRPMAVIEGKGQPVSRLVGCLSDMLQSTVIDKTELTGKYDFAVKGFERPGLVTTAIAEPALPSIFDALQQQLGLRLVSKNVPLEVFVIDSVERPKQE